MVCQSVYTKGLTTHVSSRLYGDHAPLAHDNIFWHGLESRTSFVINHLLILTKGSPINSYIFLLAKHANTGGWVCKHGLWKYKKYNLEKECLHVLLLNVQVWFFLRICINPNVKILDHVHDVMMVMFRGVQIFFGSCANKGVRNDGQPLGTPCWKIDAP